MILVAAASTSMIIAAFSGVAQLSDYQKRHHIYSDHDGEALLVEHQTHLDRTTRLSIALLALAAFILSVWNWTVQKHTAGLALVTIAWVSCHSGFLSTCLTNSADNHHFGLPLHLSTIAQNTKTLRDQSAHSCFINRIVARISNSHLQKISRTSRILAANCPWSIPSLHMLFFATAT